TVDEQRRGPYLRHHPPELHGDETLSFVGHTAGHHNGLDLIPAKAQVDPQLVEGLSHLEGQLRYSADFQFLHLAPLLLNHLRFLPASSKPPIFVSGMVARGCTPKYFSISSGVTKVSFMRYRTSSTPQQRLAHSIPPSTTFRAVLGLDFSVGGIADSTKLGSSVSMIWGR